MPNDSHLPIGPLRASTRNPRYFEDPAGRIVFLSGSHNWANFQDFTSDEPLMPLFDFDKYLDFMVEHRMNWFRLWHWDYPRSPMRVDVYATTVWRRAPWPWPRTGPGNAGDGLPKFDLSQFDESYFARLRQRVIAAGRRGVYAAIMLFGGVEHFTARGRGPTGFPFDRSSNVNGVHCGTFRSETLSGEALPFQEAYVRRVIETVNDLGNVMYEIANEAGSHSIEWQFHMIDLIKAYQAGLPNQHPVGVTNITEVEDQVLFDSNADWMSPSGANGYGVPADPPSSTGKMVIVNDTDHSAFYPSLQAVGPAGQRAWVWKSFTRGCNLAFMDPYLMPWPGRNVTDGVVLDPVWNTIRNGLKFASTLAARVDLAVAFPAGHLASTGFCLASPSGPSPEFVVYVPAKGIVSVDLTSVEGVLNVEWIDAVSGDASRVGQCQGGAWRDFDSAAPEDAVLYLHR